MKNTIDADEVRRVLAYNPDTGVFRWIVSLNKRIRIDSVAGGQNGTTGYLMIMIHGERYAGHRLAFLWMTGSFPPEDVDHINGVRDDNRWLNLRPVSRAENQMNCGIRSNNITGVVGVSWNKYHGKWQSTIKSDRVQIHIGYFDDFDEAVRERKEFERQIGYHPNHGNVTRTWGKA